MTELIIVQNKESYLAKRDRNSIKYENPHKREEIIGCNSIEKKESYNSENKNLFINDDKINNFINNNNVFDEINENFNNINEISVSEKTDNISNISADRNNLNSNYLKSQKLDGDKDSNLSKQKEVKVGEEMNNENKPRFALSHKLSNLALEN